MNHRPIQWIGEVNAYLIRKTGRPVWPFIIFDKGKKLSSQAWKEAFQQALSHRASGLIIFRFEKMLGTEGYQIFLELFRNR